MTEKSTVTFEVEPNIYKEFYEKVMSTKSSGFIKIHNSLINTETILAIFAEPEERKLRIYHSTTDFHFFIDCGDDYEEVVRKLTEYLGADILAETPRKDNVVDLKAVEKKGE